jgi:hypothetical protein
MGGTMITTGVPRHAERQRDGASEMGNAYAYAYAPCSA